MQTPQARVIRGGTLTELDATELVPGDIVALEAGDIVPADGRLLRSATLETQEAALTGESAPIAKDPGTLDTADVALGDRNNMVFQNTSVTRGTACPRSSLPTRTASNWARHDPRRDSPGRKLSWNVATRRAPDPSEAVSCPTSRRWAGSASIASNAFS